MSLQSLVAALLVIGSAAFAAWTLMPAAGRRFLARAALRWPLPELVARRARRLADAPGGCACDGCDRGSGGTAGKKAGAAKANRAGAAGPSVQPIRFHPRGRS